MNPEIKLHVGHFEKYILEDESLLVIKGDLAKTLVSKQLYEERHKIDTKSTTTPAMHRLLLGCSLAAASLSDRESWGWSLTLQGEDWGYFVGMEPEGMICCRKREAEKDMAKVYLQRKQPKAPMTQSHFTPRSNDALDVVEQYFEEVQQLETRMEYDNNHCGYMVQALPGADFGQVKQMDKNAFLERYRTVVDTHKLLPLNDFIVYYECRCNDGMILDMVNNLGKEQQAELFAANEDAEVECPRCGRVYLLQNNQLNN